MTTSAQTTHPDRTRQAAAAGAILALVAAVVFLALFAAARWEVVVLAVGLLGAAVLAGWVAISRRGTARLVALVVLAAALLALVLALVATQSIRGLVVGVLLGAASISAAGYALRTGSGSDELAAATPAARHPVLLMNPKSGGGKAERFRLAELCRERGIEPIVLGPGDDLLALAEDAVARGADLVGMAGGDGSQALVASVASRHGIPHVVVPAGTRNHFALDLGLDRDDVVGALDAYADGVDHPIDLAEVNGRVFVNNASMGVYARIVQSPEYRGAKLRTASDMLPEIVGPDATPMDLRFTLPTGEECATALLLLVSNNPYDLRHLRGGGTRARVDGGVLGVVSVQVRSALDAERLAALDAVGQVQRYPGWQEWTPTEFEVRSGGPVEIGVDGEALALDPPLRFVIRPGALTVRLPRGAVGLSPAARIVRPASRTTLERLVRLAVGRPE